MWTVLICVVTFVIILILYHNIKLRLERKKIVPNGKIVKVDGDDFHVYSEGTPNDKPTLVMMSGASMPAPVYHYKKLYTLFSDEYRVVVPEKFGYGYSSINDSSRDIENILEQTRQALKLAGEKPPYILMPHSMSGIEAQLWVHKYPDEIRGIVGLDMALPQHYESMNLGFRQKVYQLSTYVIRAIGVQRLPLIHSAAGVNDKGSLPEEEWEQEKYLIARNTLNKMIVMESTTILEGALKVKSMGVLDIPMLLFVSDGTVMKHWLEHYHAFLKNENRARMVELDCGHMMHNSRAEKIVCEAKTWIENTLL